MTGQMQNRSHRSHGTCLAIAILVAGFAVAPVRAQVPREQLYSLLDNANTAFREANAATDEPARAEQLYDQAILLYEKIVDQGGVHNARLYYNLANAYFLTGDLGHAILNYRRAEQLDRGDMNIRNNLAFARNQRIDRVAVTAEKRVLDTLFFWHYDFSIRTRFFLACLFFGIGALAVTAMLWLGRGPATTAVAIVSAIVLSCLLASVVVESVQRHNTVSGVVTASEIMARQGDGPNYPPSFEDPLHAGTEFEVLEQRPGWLHIELSDGSEGWIPDDAAGLV